MVSGFGDVGNFLINMYALLNFHDVYCVSRHKPEMGLVFFSLEWDGWWWWWRGPRWSLCLYLSMEKRIIRSFFYSVVRKKCMKPFLLKCGLALALTFAGFLYSHIRTKRIKHSTTSPRGHHTRLFLPPHVNISVFSFVCFWMNESKWYFISIMSFFRSWESR